MGEKDGKVPLALNAADGTFSSCEQKSHAFR